MFGLGKRGKSKANDNYRRIAANHHKIECVVCGAISGLEVHHKDRNRRNNKPKNLEWRCRKHHLEVHGKGSRQTQVTIAPKRERKKRWLFLRTERDYRRRLDVAGPKGTPSKWADEKDRIELEVKVRRRKKRWMLLRKGTAKKTIRL